MGFGFGFYFCLYLFFLMFMHHDACVFVGPIIIVPTLLPYWPSCQCTKNNNNHPRFIPFSAQQLSSDGQISPLCRLSPTVHYYCSYRYCYHSGCTKRKQKEWLDPEQPWENLKKTTSFTTLRSTAKKCKTPLFHPCPAIPSLPSAALLLPFQIYEVCHSFLAHRESTVVSSSPITMESDPAPYLLLLFY